MEKEMWFSSGETALLLGVSRDALNYAIRKGAPDCSQRAGGRRLFSEEDILALSRWFTSRGKRINCPLTDRKEKDDANPSSRQQG